jgi:PKD repeat protein
VTLEVADAAGNTATDTLIVTVLDTEAPVAVAGDDVQAEVGGTVRFDGSASSDNVGVVRFEWSFTYDGESQVLTGATPGFVFSNLGEYTVALVVADDAGNTGYDTLTVTVLDAEPPVAVAGDDIELLPGGTVELDASASSDNVDIVSYVWTFTYEGEVITLLGIQVSFTFEALGEYVVTLTVEDTLLNVDIDTVTVTVEDPEPPVADAGEDIEVDQHTTVTFDGSGCTDNVALISIKWTFDYDGEPQVLNGTSPEFVFHTPGVYDVTLGVLDVALNWAEDTVTVTVLDTEPPVAAAPDLLGTEWEDEVVLDGSASTDNVGIVSWTWTFIDRFTDITLEGERVTYEFEEPGDYDVTLTVEDARGNSDSDTTVVTVIPLAPSDPPDDVEPVRDWSLVALYAGVAAAIAVVIIVTVLVILRRPGMQ